MKNGITLYFVRHGQTTWNFDRRIQGQIDTPLNETGRAQAARNGGALKRLLGDRITQLPFVSSPLARCRETMEIIRTELSLPQQGYGTDDRLQEIHFGNWQASYWSKVAEEDPAGFGAREKDPFGWRPEGGESYRDLTARVAAWLEGIHEDTVVVAHGGVSRALRGHVLTLNEADIPELSVPQDKILVLRRDGMEWV